MSRGRYAVLTISDRSAAGERDDRSGPVIREMLEAAGGWDCIAVEILPDERSLIEKALICFSDEKRCDLVLTTGGTGLAPRDVTPEATRAVIDRDVPGIAEAMRAAGLAKTPYAMLSRGVCGQRGKTLILNLSGSPKAVREQLEVVLPVFPHALKVASGRPQDCGAESENT